MKTELEAIIDQMITRGSLFEQPGNEFDKNFILIVLDRHINSLSKAADALGIHRNTLSKRMLEYTNGVNGNGHKNGNKNGHKRAQLAQPKGRGLRIKN